MQIEVVNDFTLRLLGYQREELPELKSFKELLPVKARAFFEISHWPALRLNGSVREMAYRMEHADGTELPVLINSERIENSESGIISYQHLIYPIKQRYAYEQGILKSKKDLEQKLAFRDQQLSSIIHELRSPLHGLMNLVELLGQSQDGAERHKLVGAMSSTGRHMAQLINGLLDWSRLEASGTLQLQTKDFNLQDNLDELVTLFEIQALAKGVKLVTSFDSSLASVVNGDQNRLNQLLHNLLSNAIKFTETGAVTLMVAPGQLPDKVIFEVSDTGRGIPPEDIVRILQPFGQLDNQPGNVGGSGLGLSITQGILKVFGSELKIESEVGLGAKFSFELSLPAPHAKTSSREANPTDAFAHLKVLAADDVAVNRLVLKNHLEKIGVGRFQIVADGSAVIDVLQKDNDFQLILLDLEMPKLNGFATARRIRAKWPELAFSLAALTAYSDQEMHGAEDLQLFDAVLFKPFAADALKELLLGLRAMEGGVSPNRTTPNVTDFSLGQLNELFDDDPDEKAEFIQVFLSTLNEVDLDLSKAGKVRDAKSYGSARHKLMSMVNFFSADRVGVILSQAKSALASGEIDKFNTLERERKSLFAEWKKFVGTF